MTLGLPDSDPPPVYDSHTMTEPKKEDGTTSGAEPRYIYYHIYAPDGAIPSNSPFDSTKPFVGRIPARSVPPPHTVTTLKRCFVKKENIADPAESRTALYHNLYAHRPLDNLAKLAILGPGHANGTTPQTAFALVFVEELTAEENTRVRALESGENIEVNPEYLYYHLFTQFDEDTSATRFHPNEPALGRVEKIRISPPHTAATTKRCIAKAEGKPICAYAGQLFADIAADTVMANSAYISLIRNDCAGSTADKPLVLVQPERGPGFYTIPIQVISPGKSWGSFKPELGTLLYTDGVPDSLRGNVGRRLYKCSSTCGSKTFDGCKRSPILVADFSSYVMLF
ncbi:hypothetical protein B0H17DRAFT_1109175 [Mycena rosella]|uniref:Uncharacterized protein n=1 Tax=Mycena rosella TaxID=1033263 RepID=A0AAD7BWF3_MYCRO|nr:hypothetical protein B0H17DRAFT_1109175 [Mycena rosella]